MGRIVDGQEARLSRFAIAGVGAGELPEFIPLSNSV
jgi:hypothetical protein